MRATKKRDPYETEKNTQLANVIGKIVVYCSNYQSGQFLVVDFGTVIYYIRFVF